MEKLRIVVGGFIGLYATGGVTWDYIQYPLGLKLLGHDVYYIEDTGQYSCYRITERAWDDPFDTVEYLRKTMEAFGLGDRWAYRDTFSGRCYGIPLNKVREICNTADVFMNISSSVIYRNEYLRIPKRVLIDSDPMFTQIQTLEKEELVDKRYVSKKIIITDYNYHFSFGENIGSEDCKIPSLNISWLTTRQPVCMDCWIDGQSKILNKHANSFTTIMNWSTRSKLNFDNEEWGQKDVEFNKFVSIPQLYKKAKFEIVLAVSPGFRKEVNYEKISQQGWGILEPVRTIGTAKRYKSFIMSSFAEFSVAKETYVKSNSGWFSCRSACYLASGKPVITQETGWSKFIPAGEGLLAFHDAGSAVDALAKVTENNRKHALAAREIAYEYFASEKVLSAILDKICF